MTISRSDRELPRRSGGPAAIGRGSHVSDARAIRADLAVVGAGPAGLSAAVTAADAGVRVVLIDAEPVVGGQFWRHPGSGSRPGGVKDREVAGLHHDLRHYRRLRAALAGHTGAGSVIHLAAHEVWSIGQPSASTASLPLPHPPDPSDPLPPWRFEIETITGEGSARRPGTVRARTLVLATGAYDLQLPFPGWDLPGVMTAGGVQSLLKGHAVLAGRRVVVAGTGPFLLSVACGLARGGASVLGVYEAASPTGWLREPRGVLAAGSKVAEGAGYARDLLRHRIGYHSGWAVLAADGDNRLRTVTVAPLDSSGVPVPERSRELAADVLAVGWGFVPQLDLPLALGCDTAAGPDGMPVAVVDAAQRSTVPGVYLAGEVCGIGGAALAAVEGEIAGRAAAVELGATAAESAAAGVELAVDPAESRRRRDRRLRRRRSTLRAFAQALQRVYPVPAGWMTRVRDDTVVCRCEEVTAGTIRDVAHRDGVADARTAKLLVRPGMGWCQGRICGYPTECLVESAGARDGRRAEFRPVQPVQRSVVTPIPLGLVATQPPADQ